jgi:excisionase family DNA binding protein
MTNDALMTTTEAGQVLGRNSRAVQRLVKKGRLKHALKLAGPNGAYLFDREEVQRVAAELTQEQVST